MTIHHTALVDSKAQLDSSVVVGPYAIIGPQVSIGKNSTVGSHTVIEGRTSIGERNTIFHHASIGAAPQDLKYAGEDSALVVGHDNTIREFTTLHRGTAGGGLVTRLGNKNLLMAYVHIAHDCQVQNGCVFANAATLGGHVEVADNAFLGGLTAVHQFCRIGKHAFTAGGSLVVMDLAPYCSAQGDRAELVGLNTTGLERHGFSTESIARIKDAYRTVFRAKLTLNEAIEKLKTDFGDQPEIEVLIEFISTPKRGLIRPR
jgi:UDP-N-acetylglucosamine acyltransferase